MLKQICARKLCARAGYPVIIVKTDRAVARTLIGGGGGGILIYSGSARLTSFEINFISKEASRAEPEYMNIHPPPPISALATALKTDDVKQIDCVLITTGAEISTLIYRKIKDKNWRSV